MEKNPQNKNSDDQAKNNIFENDQEYSGLESVIADNILSVISEKLSQNKNHPTQSSPFLKYIRSNKDIMGLILRPGYKDSSDYFHALNNSELDLSEIEKFISSEPLGFIENLISCDFDILYNSLETIASMDEDDLKKVYFNTKEANTKKSGQIINSILNKLFANLKSDFNHSIRYISNHLTLVGTQKNGFESKIENANLAISNLQEIVQYAKRILSVTNEIDADYIDTLTYLEHEPNKMRKKLSGTLIKKAMDIYDSNFDSRSIIFPDKDTINYIKRASGFLSSSKNFERFKNAILSVGYMDDISKFRTFELKYAKSIIEKSITLANEAMGTDDYHQNTKEFLNLAENLYSRYISSINSSKFSPSVIKMLKIFYEKTSFKYPSLKSILSNSR